MNSFLVPNKRALERIAEERFGITDVSGLPKDSWIVRRGLELNMFADAREKSTQNTVCLYAGREYSARQVTSFLQHLTHKPGLSTELYRCLKELENPTFREVTIPPSDETEQESQRSLRGRVLLIDYAERFFEATKEYDERIPSKFLSQHMLLIYGD